MDRSVPDDPVEAMVARTHARWTASQRRASGDAWWCPETATVPRIPPSVLAGEMAREFRSYAVHLSGTRRRNSLLYGERANVTALSNPAIAPSLFAANTDLTTSGFLGDRGPADSLCAGDRERHAAGGVERVARPPSPPPPSDRPHADGHAGKTCPIDADDIVAVDADQHASHPHGVWDWIAATGGSANAAGNAPTAWKWTAAGFLLVVGVILLIALIMALAVMAHWSADAPLIYPTPDIDDGAEADKGLACAAEKRPRTSDTYPSPLVRPFAPDPLRR